MNEPERFGFIHAMTLSGSPLFLQWRPSFGSTRRRPWPSASSGSRTRTTPASPSTRTARWRSGTCSPPTRATSSAASRRAWRWCTTSTCSVSGPGPAGLRDPPGTGRGPGMRMRSLQVQGSPRRRPPSPLLPVREQGRITLIADGVGRGGVRRAVHTPRVKRVVDRSFPSGV